MSGVVLRPHDVTAPTLDVEAATRHLVEAPERAAQTAAVDRLIRVGGLWGYVFGTVMGVLGMGAATAMVLSWNPAPPVFIRQNPVSGELSANPRPIEAVESFNEGTVRQHLRFYLDGCESYLWATYNATERHCQLLLDPVQRQKFADLMNPTNADSPKKQLGRDGSMSVADRVTYQPMIAGKDGVQVWSIRFFKIIARPGKPVECWPWQATVTFKWRPELKMAEEDRPYNLGGMQISDRRSGPDDALKEVGCKL